MLFIGFGRRLQKGVMTPEKLKRLEGIAVSTKTRATNIISEFDSNPTVKKQTELMSQLELKILKLHRKPGLAPDQQLDLFLSMKSFLDGKIIYLAELKRFAKTRNANHRWLKKIDNEMDQTKKDLKSLG